MPFFTENRAALSPASPRVASPDRRRLLQCSAAWLLLPAADVAWASQAAAPPPACPVLELKKSSDARFLYEPAPREAGMVREICEAVCVGAEFRVVVSHFPNSDYNVSAYVIDGHRVIATDPKLMRAVALPGPRDWHGLFMLGHEIGHHLCGHIGQKKGPEETDPEADRFAGFALARLGGTRDNVASFFNNVPALLAKEALRIGALFTNPFQAGAPMEVRLAAAIDGWQKGAGPRAATIP